MSRVDPARAALSLAVNTCRRVLVGDRQKTGAAGSGDIGAQLEAPYGFDPKTGVPRPLDELTHLSSWQRPTAQMLREWHAHLTLGAAGGSDAERALSAYDQMKYELGYTVLHRLCALRMAEERGIVRECVRKGQDSEGFRMFLRLADGSGLGTHEDAYAFFLARVFDELANELPSVFDRRGASSLVTAGARALTALLETINAEALLPLWLDDETLGWIFEDYNDPEERKEMRALGDAPRNARELAVRNQFFTPRWVVAFLTDNTLGRLWYEACGGQTALATECRFLLKPATVGAVAPRDPRSIKVLDPACGSGHFLLYVCDLFETIYREAWHGRVQRSEGVVPLWEAYPDEQAFLAAIPGLVLEHNVYGVDIDPRCIQEAGLALWLRAHRQWDALGIAAKDRPRLGRVGLVCAHDVAGSAEQRGRLRARLQPPVLGLLVDALFQNVAEMGLLLRVETAIAGAVEAVKKDYLSWRESAAQGGLFGGSAADGGAGFAELRDAGGDEAFWRDADRLLLGALEGIGEEGEDGEHYGDRLFAEGVRGGVDFLDVARMRFDVVVMNPPFGVPSEGTKAALDVAYPNAGHDLYAMFYERMIELLAPGGRVGAITSRAWLALPTLGAFRREVLGGAGTVETVADFGYGVLNAKVETAAAVVRAGGDVDALGTWVRLVKTGRKEEVLLEAMREGGAHRAVSAVAWRHFAGLPAGVCGYWMSTGLVGRFGAGAKVGAKADAVVGLQTSDDGRFLRLGWEVPAGGIGLEKDWARFAKGGESRLFFDDVHLAARWTDAGAEIGAFANAYIRNPQHYGKRGVTWPRRTNLRMSPRILPAGCAFGDKGPAAVTDDDALRPALLATLCSAPAFLLLSVRFQTADDSSKAISKSYEVGLIRDLPWPALTPAQSTRLTTLATTAVALVRLGQIEDDDAGETVLAFAVPPALLPLPDGTRATTLAAAAEARVAAREDRLAQLSAIQAEIDDIVATAYAFTPRDRQVMDEELEPPLTALPGPAAHPIDDALFTTAYLTKDALDGALLPGGLEAETDVRTEHRRKKRQSLRDETTLCRVFQAPPSDLAATRRRLSLLRPDDLQRIAADIVSYAVGVAFGRWDIRLHDHPDRIPAFTEAFDPMPACPLGQLIASDGLPATPQRIASAAWLTARTHPTTLPPADDMSAATYPLPVAWDGLLEDDRDHDASPRLPPDGLRARVDAVLEHLFGAARPDWEHDLAAALGFPSITDYLRTPAGFFADHLSRHTKSGRQAPVYWPLTTASNSLTYWLYAPRLSPQTLPTLLNRLRTTCAALRHDRDATEAPARRAALDLALRERTDLFHLLEDTLAWGYEPHPDDGFVVTASPLHAAFRLPKWRDILAATWKSLEAGDLDWAHLAMRRRPEQVTAKCRTDRSLAIAHGLESLYEPPAPKTKTAKKAPPVPNPVALPPLVTQMTMLDASAASEPKPTPKRKTASARKPKPQ